MTIKGKKNQLPRQNNSKGRVVFYFVVWRGKNTTIKTSRFKAQVINERESLRSFAFRGRGYLETREDTRKTLASTTGKTI